MAADCRGGLEPGNHVITVRRRAHVPTITRYRPRRQRAGSGFLRRHLRDARGVRCGGRGNDIYHALRHTAYAPAAVATARVTVLHTGVYRLRILATHLPAPETLRVALTRHVYLAWAFDGKDPGGALRAVRLVFHRPTGAYSADGVVRINHITELFITADKAGGREAPTMPEVSVLSTVGHLQL